MIYRWAAVSLFVLQLNAQMPGDSFHAVARGHLLADESTNDSYTVSLYSPLGGMPPQRAQVGPFGEFEVAGVPPGEYQLTVTNRTGDVLKQEMIYVGGSPIEVRLPERRAAQGKTGVVTLAQLAHKIPRKAMHEFRKANEARERGDVNASISHLLAAVEFDPSFAEAHNDLAAQYIGLKRYPEALTHLDEASKLDPASSTIALNRAICLDRLHDLKQAETSARRAIELNPLSRHSQFALAIILIQQKKTNDEAIRNLIAAAEEYPVARLTAAQILVAARREQEAQDQLQRYLKDCSGEYCSMVQNWSTQLSRDRKGAAQ